MSMTYALDSNIVSYMLKNDLTVYENYRQADRNGHSCVIPALVYYEVQRGLLAKRLINRLTAFEKLCQNTLQGDFDQAVWKKAAQLYANLSQKGNLIDDADIFIAAFCIVNNYTLVTNNENHFKRIDGLKMVNWINPS